MSLESGCKSEISSKYTWWSVKFLESFPALPAVHHRHQVRLLPKGLSAGISSSLYLFGVFPECRALDKYLSLPAVCRRRQVRHLPGICCGQLSCQLFLYMVSVLLEHLQQLYFPLGQPSLPPAVLISCKSLVPAACSQPPPSPPPVNPPPLSRCKALLKAGCMSDISSEDTWWSLRLLESFPVLPAVHRCHQVRLLPKGLLDMGLNFLVLWGVSTTQSSDQVFVAACSPPPPPSPPPPERYTTCMPRKMQLSVCLSLEGSALTQCLPLRAVRRRFQVHHLPGVHCGKTSCQCLLYPTSPQASCAYFGNYNPDSLALTATCCNYDLSAPDTRCLQPAATKPATSKSATTSEVQSVA